MLTAVRSLVMSDHQVATAIFSGGAHGTAPASFSQTTIDTEEEKRLEAERLRKAEAAAKAERERRAAEEARKAREGRCRSAGRRQN